MKIGIVGAGAVGGLLGGMLRAAGHDVLFLGRGQHLQAMQQNGLLIKFATSQRKTLRIKGRFSDEVKDLSDRELLLFTVKSTQTKEMMGRLLPHLKAGAIVITLQNGVDNEEILAQALGEERLLSGAAYLSAEIESPGVIEVHSSGLQLIIGYLDGRQSQDLTRLVGLFNQAGVHCRPSAKIMERKWHKLLWNVTFNPLSAATGETIGEILDDAELHQTARRVLKEAVQVAEALQVSVRRDIETVVFQGAEEARGHKTSMLQDREQGKPMEIESICGYFVHQAAQLGLRTPTIHTLYSILLAIDKKRYGQHGNKGAETSEPD
ncbi:2-dehydropantoate 2-reductase [Caldalkalibacillus thermarum TA2.A1]|uniref:2-dehydropantoate 2-reductase n=1 Tax=Caldalkalibacillus thermarum (strain TA2.A1) TaxID=986075 RepID=A0A8X8I7I0_CALTT|nr:2-dehydropantoate 2-reductase [Caldalkalibacillus thermarum TA2.A1]